jgi:lipopolysaccharide/colanic/teichoic acid biosynthesis glycosyltransferase
VRGREKQTLTFGEGTYAGLTVTGETRILPTDRSTPRARAGSRATAVACRALDVTIAALLLVALFPILLIVALIVRLDSPGPAVFRQRRLGLGARAFTVNKFRTMYAETSAEPHREYVVGLISGSEGATGQGERPLYKLSADPRVTRLGGFLRKWSIDELPQVWNVLRGEMSLVGPRPALPYEVEHYASEWFQRFEVKPGLTGLWQVSGRSELSFTDMLDLDCEYAQRRSFWMNLRILAKTARVVLEGRGAA